MSSSTMSIMGYDRYLKGFNDDLFKNLIIPNGIDRDTLINNILLRCVEFEVLYSSPYFTQEVIGTWSKKWYKTFEKWVKANEMEYNPIENYDRKEEWTDENTSQSTDLSTGTGKVSAFNVDSFSDASQTTSNGQTNLSSNGQHTGRTHGNIGVTTTQEMLQSEYEIAKFNIIEEITYLFVAEFCIPVY